MTAVGTGLEHTAPYRAVGAMQLAGGALMVAGALLPWLTLLAGSRPIAVFSGGTAAASSPRERSWR